MSDTELENILLTFANRVLDVRNGSDNPTLGELVDTPTQAILSLIEAEKALVLEEVLEQKKHYIVEFGFKNPNFEEAVPTKVIQKELDQVTQIIKGVK